MLYLSGDDNNPYGLLEPLNELVGRLGAMPYNPSMRLVVLYDGNAPGDSHLYVREPKGLLEPNPLPPWFPSNKELNMGSPNTLHNFVRWAHDIYPGSRHTLLSIVDHGGGWAPDFGDEAQPRIDASVEAGGWRGMSLDSTSNASLSTKNTREALEGLGRIDVLFFDASLMGMIESADEIQPYAHYFIAGQNLLWANLPYEHYLAATMLTSVTTPYSLTKTIIQSYNRLPPNNQLPDNQPFTIAAVDLLKLPDLVTKTNILAQDLLSNLDGPQPITGAESKIRAIYRAAQKFDYDASRSIDPTDGYADLADFARRLGDDTTFPMTTRNAAQAVFKVIVGAAQDPVVIFNNPHSARTKKNAQSIFWDLSGARGLSIYLPLGEQDRRPNGPLDEQGNATPYPQLTYYADPAQLAFTRDAPNWAALLLRLKDATPLREQVRPPEDWPFHTPSMLRTNWRINLPFIANGAKPHNSGAAPIIAGISQVIPATPQAGQSTEIRVAN
jgi:hypothetical protein